MKDQFKDNHADKGSTAPKQDNFTPIGSYLPVPDKDQPMNHGCALDWPELAEKTRPDIVRPDYHDDKLGAFKHPVKK